VVKSCGTVGDSRLLCHDRTDWPVRISLRPIPESVEVGRRWLSRVGVAPAKFAGMAPKGRYLKRRHPHRRCGVSARLLPLSGLPARWFRPAGHPFSLSFPPFSHDSLERGQEGNKRKMTDAVLERRVSKRRLNEIRREIEAQLPGRKFGREITDPPLAARLFRPAGGPSGGAIFRRAGGRDRRGGTSM